MKVSQHEQKEDNENVNILANEIKSCKDFEYALREESALLFNEMLSECGQNKDYIRFASAARSDHGLFGYNHRRSNPLNRGIAKYVRPVTSIMVINKLKNNGCNPKKGLRTNDASELMQYAPINETIAIFHLGGGTTAFMSGIVNHVSKPVTLWRVEYLLISSINESATSEFSHASSEA